MAPCAWNNCASTCRSARRSFASNSWACISDMIASEHRSRPKLDPFLPQSFFVEQERSESGEAVSVATIFLTNRECPWRCIYCDLWKNTVTETVPAGAIPAQIDFALSQLRGTACSQ